MDIYCIKRKEDFFEIIDQNLLPHTERYCEIKDCFEMIKAIKMLKIRGAPAIGIAAAVAAYLACKNYVDANIAQDNASSQTIKSDFLRYMSNVIAEIENSRPTAVNLFHATEKIKMILKTDHRKWMLLINDLVNNLMQYEYNACEKMSQKGLDYIPHGFTRFLTHCNTGSLATYGIGTALGVIKKIAQKRNIEVFVDETRPLFQGARLTVWELSKYGIKNTLISDNMGAWTIKTKKIQAIITGADRIAKNGDTANKIGTLNLAILAKHFKIPFYIVAPESTIDNKIDSGKSITIEERDSCEISFINNAPIAPPNTKVFNPAFDVVPIELISAIITENRVITP